jgi:hypothetical protein
VAGMPAAFINDLELGWTKALSELVGDALAGFPELHFFFLIHVLID